MPHAIRLAIVVAFSPFWCAAATAADGPSPLELRTGEKFFRVNGKPGFVLGRNPVGVSPAAYYEHFKNAAAAGERFMRIHLAPAKHNNRPSVSTI
jgi:hypothetical protein